MTAKTLQAPAGHTVAQTTGDVFKRTFTRNARTFSFAARFLPRDRRQAATELYAFCRIVDDLADEVAPAIGVPLLVEWERWLRALERGERTRVQLSVPATVVERRLFSGSASGTAFPSSTYSRGSGDLTPDITSDIAAAVTRLVDEWGVPPRYLRQLVEGARIDATRTSVSDFVELREFCYRAAGTVAHAMCYILGATDPEARERAERLGIAMQLTNILRDLGEDAERGRVYLPEDELARFGIRRRQIEQQETGDRFVALMRFQIERARHYYAAGLPGVFMLPRECRAGILLAGRLYAAILGQIERQGHDVFRRRASTSRFRKGLTAASTYLALSGIPFMAPPEARSLPEVASL